jgi:lysophospholipase L1-like esterase
MEGANDLSGISLMPPPASPEAIVSDTVNAMEDMVREALGRGMRVLVASLPPQREGAQRGASARVVPQYNAQLQQMASNKGAMFVDVFGQFDLSLIGQDGLHPTEAGYERIAEIIQAAIASAFERPA